MNTKQYEIWGLVYDTSSNGWKNVKVATDIFECHQLAYKHLRTRNLNWLYESVMNPYVSKK